MKILALHGIPLARQYLLELLWYGGRWSLPSVLIPMTLSSGVSSFARFCHQLGKTLISYVLGLGNIETS
jgi:hypothetical protein